ncbi:unnamed protein product [Closterium sp. Naga37s-1]|nr:unnamed protein product [Closterium sp. Naga37s-1]
MRRSQFQPFALFFTRLSPPTASLRLDSPPATSATTAASIIMATTRAAPARRALPLLPLLALSLTAALLLSFTSPSDALGWSQMTTKYTCNPSSNYGMWFKYGCNCQAINTTELGYKKLWATCPGVNPSAYGRRAFGNVWLESVGYADWVTILMQCARKPYHISNGFNGKCAIPNIYSKPYYVGGSMVGALVKIKGVVIVGTCEAGTHGVLLGWRYGCDGDVAGGRAGGRGRAEEQLSAVAMACLCLYVLPAPGPRVSGW